MKFSLILNSEEITVITEDGGIACIREAEDMSPDEPRESVTDYYQMRLTDVPASEADGLFEHLAEGKIYCKDWVNAKYNSLEVIEDALSWLCVGESNWELVDNLFPQFFGSTEFAKTSIPPKEYLGKIASADAFDLLNMLLETPNIIQNNYLLNVIRSRNKALAMSD